MQKGRETNDYRASFALLTILFFMWGFITVTNDVLISTFRSIFSLSVFQSSLVQSAFFGAFFVISLGYYLISMIKGDPINKIGYKAGMVIGLLGCSLGCALFYPAAVFESYGYFLAALFVLASGVTILQIAANPYAAIMGTPETSSGRLNFAQGFNSLGTTLGPLVGALLIFVVFAQDSGGPMPVASTYLVYAGLFLACALLVMLSKMPAFKNEDKAASGLGALKFPQMQWGILAIFLYVGGEVAVGSFLLDFFKEDDIMALPKEEGTKFLSYYWGGLMIGRLLGALSLNNKLGQMQKAGLMAAVSLLCFFFIYFVTSIKTAGGNYHFEFIPLSELGIYMGLLAVNFLGLLWGSNAAAKSLMIFGLINVVLLVVASQTAGYLAAWMAIGVGLFCSIMWSNIFTLSIRGLGEYTSQGSSLLIMAVVGGAIIPPLQGNLADSLQSFQASYLVPAACFLYIAFFGWKMQALFSEKNSTRGEHG
jgi:FHS family L-fucose permease-like MFS transporter